MTNNDKNHQVVVEMQGISKHFPGVQALKGVDFAVQRGTIHALVGENGAGKSTLMKILSGLYRPDNGKLFFLGREVVFHNTREALNTGVSTIYQELLLCPNLRVAENIFLGREPTRNFFLQTRQLFDQCRADLNEMGFGDLDPWARISDLTVAQRQMVEIAKALHLDNDLIIMDEPTSSLTPGEVKRLFGTMRQLKERGKAIIFISHKIEEIFEIADHVTVLRDGELVGSKPIGELTYNEVVRMMVNRDLAASRSQRYTGGQGELLLEVENLTRHGFFKNISFSLREHEVLGFAGLVGAGRTELMRAIFGIDPLDSGQIQVEGRVVKIKSPQDAIRLGLGMATEDRKDDGLFNDLSVRENMTMAYLGLGALTRLLGFVRRNQEHELVNGYVEKMSIRTPGTGTPIINLSGGNQQKVILSRWLMAQPKILILDEPTRGIDVGTKAEIHKLIRQLAEEGHGIIVVSSELPELLAVSDHIIVMREGQATAQLVTVDTSQEEIMTYATIGSKEKELP
jgi:ABC-type sugar transport system ATPase subunit